MAINLNYYKDPKTGVWREPLPQEMGTFKTRNPKAHDQYIAAKAEASGGASGGMLNGKMEASNTTAVTPPAVITAQSPKYLFDDFTTNTGIVTSDPVSDKFINVRLRPDGDNGLGSIEDMISSKYSNQDYTGPGYLLKTPPQTPPPDTSWSLGETFDDWTKVGEGGSKFGNLAAGLGSLYGIYAGMQGVKEAKKSVAFQREQYEDQKAQQKRADERQDKFGLALSAAMPSKKVG